MSNDPGIDNPIGGISEPKSKKKLWIYGGLGCFGLIGLICIGCVGIGYVLGKPSYEFINENTAFIQSSAEIQAELGSPITLTDLKPVPGGPGKIVYRAEVEGPNGSGTCVIEATMDGLTPVRDSIYLEVGDERIDLDPDAELNLNIDDGTN